MDTTIVTLLVAGLLFLWIEMMVPGMIVGTLGALSLIAGVVLAYTTHGAEVGTYTLLGSLVGVGLLMVWWVKFFQKTRVGKKMTLSESVTGGETGGGLSTYINMEGQSVTPLRPSGTVIVDGKRVDAQTDGEWIDAGQNVRVVRVHGATVIVRKSPPAEIVQ